jgi:hypothetical protein
MVRSVAVLVCCACVGSACVDDSSTSTTLYAPTLLTVDPLTFLGTVRCGSELQKFVVTLFDVTSGTPASLGSAPPTECTTPVTFGTGKITVGHAYIVEIDGYDRDVVPEGGNDTGSRVMLDPTTLAHVFPRWATTCGQPIPIIRDGEAPPDADAQVNPLRYPTIPLQNIEVTFHGCLPFRTAELPDAGADEPPPDGPADAAMPDASSEAPEDASSPAE